MIRRKYGQECKVSSKCSTATCLISLTVSVAKIDMSAQSVSNCCLRSGGERQTLQLYIIHGSFRIVITYVDIHRAQRSSLLHYTSHTRLLNCSGSHTRKLFRLGSLTQNSQHSGTDQGPAE